MPRTSKKRLKESFLDSETSKGRRLTHEMRDFSVFQAIRVYNTAAYVRLSVEDARKKVSDSIGTQKELIKSFLQTKPDLKLYNIYEDANRSGTNFNRPGFTRMLEDIQSGTIDCVVVKDLSRLGRNFKETGHYIERVFPSLMVRFISVNDNFDSLDSSADESGLIIPLKNLLNEVYARDCSKKTQSGFRVKRQRGEFCGAFAPYGYTKIGSSLVVDEEAAAVVGMIFKLRKEGVGVAAICKKLNGMNILPPSRYRFEKGIIKCEKFGKATFWHASAVNRILQNPVYTGTLIGGRYKSNFLRGGGMIETNKDEWVIEKGAHTPIVDDITYDTVQKMFSYGVKPSSVNKE